MCFLVSGLEPDLVHLETRPDSVFPAHCTGVASLCVPVDWLSCLPAVSAAPPTPRCHRIVQTLLQQDGINLIPDQDSGLTPVLFLSLVSNGTRCSDLTLQSGLCFSSWLSLWLCLDLLRYFTSWWRIKRMRTTCWFWWVRWCGAWLWYVTELG